MPAPGRPSDVSSTCVVRQPMPGSRGGSKGAWLALRRRQAAPLFRAGGAGNVREQFIAAAIADAAANQDVDRLHALAVIGAVPLIGEVDQRTVEVNAAVNAFCASERDEIGRNVRPRAGANRSRRNAGVAADF